MSSSRLRGSFLAVLGALALVATACGGGSDTAVATDVAAAESASSDAAAPSKSDSSDTSADDNDAAEPAASLVASTITGEQIDFGSLEGQDVVLWFWAPW